jgi:hypothetical protein
MAITNHERVGKALELLKNGLGPFVEREFKSAYRDRAAAEVSRFMSEDRLNAMLRGAELPLVCVSCGQVRTSYRRVPPIRSTEARCCLLSHDS